MRFAPTGTGEGIGWRRRAIWFACQTLAALVIVTLALMPDARAQRSGSGNGLLLFDSWEAGIHSTVGVDEGGVRGDDINLGDVTGLPTSESVLLYALGVPYQGTGALKIAYIDISTSSNRPPSQDFIFQAVTYTTASPVRVEWDLSIKELQIQDAVGAVGSSGSNRISLVAGLDEFSFRVRMTQSGTSRSDEINLTMPYGGIEFRWLMTESWELDAFVRLQPSFSGNTRGSNRELVTALKFRLSSGTGGAAWMLRIGWRSYTANLTVEKSSLDDFRFDTRISGGFFGIEVRS